LRLTSCTFVGKTLTWPEVLTLIYLQSFDMVDHGIQLGRVDTSFDISACFLLSMLTINTSSCRFSNIFVAEYHKAVSFQEPLLFRLTYYLFPRYSVYSPGKHSTLRERLSMEKDYTTCRTLFQPTTLKRHQPRLISTSGFREATPHVERGQCQWDKEAVP